MVDVLIQAPYQSIDSNLQNFAYADEGRNSDWTSRFNLLPMACRKTKRDHVLLAVATLLAQLAHSLSKTSKESFLISHL